MTHPLQPIADFAKFIAPHYTTMLVSSAVLIMIPYFLEKYYSEKKSLIGMFQGLGFFWGLLAMYSGIAGLYYQTIPDLTTVVALLIAGMTLNMQPMNRIPWSPVVGTVAGVMGGYGIASAVGQAPNMGLVAILTIVLAAIFWGIARYFEDATMVVGRIFSFAPLALLLSGGCLVQGVLLTQGLSLHPIFAGIVEAIKQWLESGVF